MTDLEPTVGPSAGDTDVVIHGDFGDAPAWACRVGDARPAAAQLVDAPTRGAGARALRCPLPTALEANALGDPPATLAEPQTSRRTRWWCTRTPPRLRKRV